MTFKIAFVLVVSALFAVSSAQDLPSEVTACIKNTGADITDIYALFGNNFDAATKEVKCYTRCLLLSIAAKVASKVVANTDAKEALSECGKVTVLDTCESAFIIYQCMAASQELQMALAP